MNIQQKLASALNDKARFEKWLKKAKKMNARQLDELFHTEHDRVFKKIDCLQCANCCKTTSPIFRDVDIKRLAKRERLSEKLFINKYLHLDKDGDYVLNSAPCPFLDGNNYCTVYEDRPLACREYPHRNRKNMYQILNLSRKNTEICPAVAEIFEKIAQ